MSSDFPEIGDVFQGRYRIEDVLGEGGFARVYLGRQVDLDRPVALKILRPGRLGEEPSVEAVQRYEMFTKRFEREAKLISRLRDPHTVVMFDYGRTESGDLYMILEYVDGATLGNLIKRYGGFAPARVANVLRQSLRSLREAHSLGILHRDIKPQNIMLFEHVGEADNVKVLDFGIAKPLRTENTSIPVGDTEITAGDGVLVGTPRYMSPEQIRGDDLTPASDIYSLGLVAFEMLTGHKAVTEPTTVRIMAEHLSAEPFRFPPELDLPDGLRRVVERMLRKDVASRYSTTDEVLEDLGDWDAVDVLDVAEAPAGDDSSNRTIATAVVLVCLLAGVGLAAWVTSTPDERAANARTTPQIEPGSASSHTPSGQAEEAPPEESDPIEAVAAEEPGEPDEVVRPREETEPIETETEVAVAEDEPSSAAADEPDRESNESDEEPRRRPRAKPAARAKPSEKSSESESGSSIKFLPVE